MIWFRRKAQGLPSPHEDLRRSLLCDAALAQLADLPVDGPDAPETRFHAAQASIQVGDRATARRQLHDLLEMPTATVPLRLLAWNGLRELDELPSPAAAAAVRGVVVEWGEAAGLCTIACYEDGGARLIEASGETLAQWAPDSAVAPQVRALLASGRRVVDHTHPHRGPSEPAPSRGCACLRVLTFAGAHIGLGTIQSLLADPIGAPVLRAAGELRAAMSSREHAAR